MKKIGFALFATSALLGLSCEEKKEDRQTVVVTNSTDMDRSNETVSIPLDKLKPMAHGQGIGLQDAETGTGVVTQLWDEDGDGQMDVLLFQPQLSANAKKTYVVTNTPHTGEGEALCYSRFVPERTDDYAWENDRVAFRTYGPRAQQMVEEGIKGGTLSSGMDAWLKRVDYPIINKWYKKELETDGSYHTDDGEGLDNFHVGISRGVGGIAKKVDTTYHISKNFTSWKTLGTGPLRTGVILTYADWDANGQTISEEKKITLDLGSNLSRFEVALGGTDTISAGLTLHDKLGTVTTNGENGWVSYWEPHADSELGTGIVVPNGQMVGHDHYETDQKDASNLFAQINVDNGKAVYYAGFGWKKSGQFTAQEQWNQYLDQFAKRLASPLEVSIK
ncbi:DUF4861 family protein [Maribacter sp. 2307ULW6-5]|uniref:DUF4861 family protein n=1 Tax=Maribacter sp. 2307ULW6-5 TaxID=3386275 RepID=UPI0039BC62AC